MKSNRIIIKIIGTKIKEVSRILFIINILVFYASFSFSQSTPKFQNKFLIVLDVQQEYTKDSMSESSAQKLIDSTNFVIENTETDHVIYLKSYHKLLNICFSSPMISVLIDTSVIWNLDERMIIVNENIIPKEKSNAFNEVKLIDFLQQNNAKEIIVIGLMAEQCVYNTLIGGQELGYEMFVVPEAIIGKTPKSKEKIIKKLKTKGVQILHL